MSLLEIKDLHTFYDTDIGTVRAVDGVSYSIEKGKTLGIVGESGCGKSAAAMSIIKLLDDNGYINSGTIKFKGRELTKLSIDEMCKIRGNEISVIFQESMTSLNPIFTIKKQIAESFIIHQHMCRKEANKKSLEMLHDVKIPNAEVVIKQYPYQLSVGMRQRVMIAIALACKPDLLIADEPTTALDVTIQAQILKLMNELKKDKGTSILFITHDLGVINQMADDIAVMYCGEVIEMAETKTVFSNTNYCHPYTEALIKSIPKLNTSKKHRLDSIAGSVPHPMHLPKGCKFSARCQYATRKCEIEAPPLVTVSNNHKIRCFYPDKEQRKDEI
ncbi:ABC transporter ATP-binding protein [Sedimentibacter sp. zth1]|uniref:ABC transporter ATP-binding protein n=1 Tax=Sedimentibacter sp. zth1 TaxID=2816908 RepID=UPI001A9263F1|nr:ABC transporter ATP-binding protein [Sedimentibacter sp. zth1]QSX04726.1 ABC transporter ATP-binding protein [Sedimentibacter sp. zth1]